MTIETIPLQQVPNQSVTVVINNSSYDLELNTRLDDLYLSVVKDGKPIVYNRICQNKNMIDNFAFIDMDAEENPNFTGLNDRFLLVWTDERNS